MVSPGFLENPEVRLWLNGVEPAWTMLDFDSFNALHDEHSASNPAIRFEPNLTATEISASAVTTNALLLLRRAAETGGLKLTGPSTWRALPHLRRHAGVSSGVG
jgi:hypothetical protein